MILQLEAAHGPCRKPTRNRASFPALQAPSLSAVQLGARSGSGLDQCLPFSVVTARSVSFGVLAVNFRRVLAASFAPSAKDCPGVKGGRPLGPRECGVQ